MHCPHPAGCGKLGARNHHRTEEAPPGGCRIEPSPVELRGRDLFTWETPEELPISAPLFHQPRAVRSEYWQVTETFGGCAGLTQHNCTESCVAEVKNAGFQIGHNVDSSLSSVSDQ